MKPGPVISTADLPDLRRNLQSQRIVLALGSFDLIHIGHIKYLEWCKQQGDILVVALKSDEQIAAHKGPSRPVIPADQRARVVSSLKPADFALIGAEGELYQAALDTAKLLQPDTVVLGPDWGPDVQDQWRADLADCEIIVAPIQEQVSTSQIIEAIENKRA